MSIVYFSNPLAYRARHINTMGVKDRDKVWVVIIEKTVRNIGCVTFFLSITANLIKAMELLHLVGYFFMHRIPIVHLV